MNIEAYPQGFRGPLAVVSATGVTGGRTWTLRSVETGQLYELAPASIEGWPLPAKREASRPNSIIVSYVGNDVIALELATGELYRTRAPATALRLRR
ncbi:TPA: hypothetical protein RH202_002946 [Escherichia coli]|nr:hypothetical protein [Escherichia coli]